MGSEGSVSAAVTAVTAMSPASMAAAPIGIFDSGVGGLSVLRHIRTCLKNEQIIYVADTLYAPYGERTEAEIEQRALRIGAFLIEHRVKAIVVACNTATAVAIHALRNAYPSLTVIGVEPGLKPAIALSRSKIIGVLATEATLASEKFSLLKDLLSKDDAARFLLQPCTGLADRIERGFFADPQTQSMLQGYIAPLLQQGADTLVLGCTHYPFVLAQIQQVASACTTEPITVVDTGEAIARRLAALLLQRKLRAEDDVLGRAIRATRAARAPCAPRAYTSGDAASLRTAFVTLLDMHVDVATADF